MTQPTDLQRIDEKLSILRESWLDSKPGKEPLWLSKIDKALDERLEVMKREAEVAP